MKKVVLVLIAIIGIVAVALLFFKEVPVDIRNEYIKKGFQSSDYQKGRALITQMQEAYGSKKIWYSYENASFKQEANWYGKRKLSGWGADPMQFIMKTKLGSEDCEILLLKGKHQGESWGISEGKTYKIEKGSNLFQENSEIKRKMIFKDYWFQFPFRIDEAGIIAYAGTENVEGIEYDLVYATWKSEQPNREFDQFILYIHPETHFIEYLHFTVRDMAKLLELTAKFDDFKQVNQLMLPQSQYIRLGKPSGNGLKMHENHYLDIRMGN